MNQLSLRSQRLVRIQIIRLRLNVSQWVKVDWQCQTQTGLYSNKMPYRGSKSNNKHRQDKRYGMWIM